MPLTADRNTAMRDKELIGLPMAANVKIYAGSLVVANATGHVAPGSAAANLIYLGRAEETLDNTGGADGAKIILIRRNKAFKWGNYAADLVTQAELGKLCYIHDDAQVAKTSSNAVRSAAGVVLGVDSDGVWVGDNFHADKSATAALDFASINAAASADLTITVPGAAVNDAVVLGLPAAPAAGLMFMAFVSAANTVTVRATNITAGAIDAAPATFRVSVT